MRGGRPTGGPSRSSAGARVHRSARPPTPVEPGSRSRVAWGLGFLAATAGLVYVTGALLSVIFGSAVMAYLLDPLVTRLQARGYRRETAIFCLGGAGFFATLAALGILIPGLVRSVGAVGPQVTPYLDSLAGRVEPWIGEIEQRFSVEIPVDFRAFVQELPGYLAKLSPDARAAIRAWLSALAGGSLEVVLSALTVSLLPVFAFYLLRDWPRIVGWIDALVPARHRAVVRRLSTDIDGRIASFVRGQLLVAAILAGIYTVGLLVAGLDLAVTMGVLSGALFLLPYIGPILAGTLSVGLALIQHGFDWHVIAVVLTYAIGQALEGTFLTPMLVGDRVGLHPLVVMIALIVCGNLLGIWGLVGALPLTAALAVLGGHVLDNYRTSRTFLG